MFELMGYQKIDFKDKEGKQIKGVKIHFCTPPTAEQKERGFIGFSCDSHFFRDGSAIPNAVETGKKYEFLFDFRNGKATVVGFKPVT